MFILRRIPFYYEISGKPFSVKCKTKKHFENADLHRDYFYESEAVKAGVQLSQNVQNVLFSMHDLSWKFYEQI